MFEKNNNIPDTPDKKSKNLHLGEDFEMWLKSREKQKNFLAQKNHLDARSQLADLNEDILGNKGPEKNTEKLVANNPNHPSDGNKRNKTLDFSALSSNYFDTRAWSKEKSPLYAISDSLVVFGRVGKDLVVDLAKLMTSPGKQIKNTIDPLDDTHLV